MPGLMLTGSVHPVDAVLHLEEGLPRLCAEFRYSWKEKFQSIPKVAPFLLIVFGVMYVLYGGVATPSEAAGVGAALCVMLAVVIYRMWSPDRVVGNPALRPPASR